MRMEARRATGKTESRDRQRGERVSAREEGKKHSTIVLIAEQISGGAARYARTRRCLVLRQGASPLRPPAPFPWTSDYTEARESVKGSLRRRRRDTDRVLSAAAKTAPPLTDSLASEQRQLEKRERGPLANGGGARLRWSAPKSGSILNALNVCLTNTGLLMEDAKKN